MSSVQREWISEDAAHGRCHAFFKNTARAIDQLTILHKKDDRGDWNELPLTVSWSSDPRLWIRKSWPPKNIDSLTFENGHLVMSFRDPWVSSQRSVIRILDQEALWSARFDFLRKRWTVVLVRYLDYETSDRPPLR